MELSTFETAVEAYLRYCRRNGFIYQQPDEILSRVERKYVYLENINGPLAEYDIEKRRIVEAER